MDKKTMDIINALYSVDYNSSMIRQELKQARESGDREKERELNGQIRFCYNLKYFAMEKLIGTKYLKFIRNEYQISGDKKYLFSLYKTFPPLEIYFRQPAQIWEFLANPPRETKEVQVMENPDTLKYDFETAVKILRGYLKMSVDEIRYAKIKIFNEHNVKKIEQTDS